MSHRPAPQPESDPAPPQPAVLEIDNLRVRFGDMEVLRGVNLKVHRGETVVLLGSSGCGKSTLLRSVIGAVEPCDGAVRILGQNFRTLPPAELDRHRTHVGMLFQSAALFQSMTSAENIACVLREHTPLEEDEIDILVRMKLEMVGLRHAHDRLPSELSGGMQKRVGLARALALNPAVMLYDEPGAGLDPVTLAQVDRLISVLGRVLRMASLVVTHELASVRRIADRVVFLHKGQVLADVPPDELDQHTDPIVRQFLDGAASGPLTEADVDDDYALALLGKGTSP